jgi:hypothetical protein
MKHGIAAAALSFFIAFAGTASGADDSGATSYDVSDATLVKSLAGFENDSAVVNGVRLQATRGIRPFPGQRRIFQPNSLNREKAPWID